MLAEIEMGTYLFEAITDAPYNEAIISLNLFLYNKLNFTFYTW